MDNTLFYRYLHYEINSSMKILLRIIQSCLLLSFVLLSLASYSCTRPKEITIEEFNEIQNELNIKYDAQKYNL